MSTTTRKPRKGARKPRKPRQRPKTPRKDQETPHVVKKQAQVAEFFGVTTHAVADWYRNGAPGGPGAYDLRELAAWRSAKSAKKIDDPDHEWKRHRADLAKIRLERERGALIDVDIHDSSILRLCTIFRAGLLASVSTLAAQLEGLNERERRDAIEQRCDEILDSVAANVRSGLPPKTKKRRAAAKGD